MNYYLRLESIPNQALNVTVVDYSLRTYLLSAAPPRVKQVALRLTFC